MSPLEGQDHHRTEDLFGPRASLRQGELLRQGLQYQIISPLLKRGIHPPVRVTQEITESQTYGQPLPLDIPEYREKLVIEESDAGPVEMVDLDGQSFDRARYFDSEEKLAAFRKKILRAVDAQTARISVPLLEPKNGLLVRVRLDSKEYRWLYCPSEMFLPQGGPQKTPQRESVAVLEEHKRRAESREAAAPTVEPVSPVETRQTGVMALLKRLLRRG